MVIRWSIRKEWIVIDDAQPFRSINEQDLLQDSLARERAFLAALSRAGRISLRTIFRSAARTAAAVPAFAVQTTVCAVTPAFRCDFKLCSE